MEHQGKRVYNRDSDSSKEIKAAFVAFCSSIISYVTDVTFILQLHHNIFLEKEIRPFQYFFSEGFSL